MNQPTGPDWTDIDAVQLTAELYVYGALTPDRGHA